MSNMMLNIYTCSYSVHTLLYNIKLKVYSDKINEMDDTITTVLPHYHNVDVIYQYIPRKRLE